MTIQKNSIVEKNIGIVKVNESVSTSFTVTKDIRTIKCSCSCTNTKQNNKTFIITYKAQPLAPHLAKIGKTQYLTSKTCTVHYTDNTVQQFKLSATVAK